MEIQEHPKLKSIINLYLDAYLSNKYEIIYLYVEEIKINILNLEDIMGTINKYHYYINTLANNSRFIGSFTNTTFDFNNKINQIIFKIRNELSIYSIKKLLFLSPEQTILALEHYSVEEFCNLNKLPINPNPVFFEYKIRFNSKKTIKTIYFLYDKNSKKLDYCEYIGKIMPMNNENHQGLYDYHLPIFKIFEQSTDYNIILSNNYDLVKNNIYIYVHTVDHITNFLKKYGTDFYKTIPKNIFQDLNNGKAIYILNSAQEGVPIAPYYHKIQRVLSEHVNRLYHKNFIIFSGNQFEFKTIHLYNSNKFIPSANILNSIKNYYNSKVNKDKIHLYTFRYFEMCIALQFKRHYATYTYKEKLAQLERNNFKTFLCFNGHEKEFRYAICFLLWQNGLSKNGSMSLRKISSTKELSTPQNKNIINNILKVNVKKWNEFLNLLPLIADKENVQLNYWYQVDLKLVNITFLWIITETTLSDNIYNFSFSFLTEKTYKPIALFMPFIMVGDKHSLKILKDEGYQTFSKWWNEDYDNISSATKRLKRIADLVKNINSKSNQEKITMYKEMKEVLEHNHNLLLSRSTNVYFNLIIK